MRSVKGFVLALAVLLATAVRADDAALKEAAAIQAAQAASGAVSLSDAELDKITAGAVSFAQHLILNPGNADVFKVRANRILCINCLGQTGNGETTGAVVIVNPARTVSRCVGKSC